MPTRAPVFGRRFAKPKAWAPTRRPHHPRLRGRAGVKLREQVKREEPLCRPCRAKGMTVATDQVDHIVPLARGGSNERSNLQGICLPCHRAKSLAERSAGRRR